MKWEKAVSRYLIEEFHSELISVSFTTSTSISDIVTKQARDEGPFMTIILFMFFIFVCFSISIQGNFYTSVGYLPIGGIISLILSSGATFGLLSIMKIQIVEPLALMIVVLAGNFHKK